VIEKERKMKSTPLFFTLTLISVCQLFDVTAKKGKGEKRKTQKEEKSFMYRSNRR